MKELNRITELFSDLYNGEPWIDVTIYATLQGITFEQAHKKAGSCNSIWQITEHMISWRNNLIKRVKGEINPADDQNYIIEISNPSLDAWNDTIKRFEASQAEWIRFLKKMKKKDLKAVYPPTGMSNYKNIQGIIQHDAYHLGQIVILAKLLSSPGDSIPVQP